jgi:hypothetical protein
MENRSVRQGVNFYVQFIFIPYFDCYVENEIRNSVEEKLLHARTHTHINVNIIFCLVRRSSDSLIVK